MSNNEENNEKNSRATITKKMNESVLYWRAIINKLTDRVKDMSLNGIKEVPVIQAEAISYRQMVGEEVRTYSIKVHKLVQRQKALTKDRFEFYATSYQVKTNGTEKLKLIESDLAEIQEFINELDEHVNFLRDTSKNLESINYSAKGKIELSNILGV